MKEAGSSDFSSKLLVSPRGEIRGQGGDKGTVTYFVLICARLRRGMEIIWG